MRWLARKSLSQYYYPSWRLLFQKHSPPWSIYLNIFQGDLLIDFPRFLMNGLTWCGKKEGSGVDYKSCPYECSKQKPFWGQAAAKVSGKTTERVLMLIRLAQDQTRRWLYPEMQGWRKVLYVFGVRAKKERGGKGRAGKKYETVAQPKETAKKATMRLQTGKFYAQYTDYMKEFYFKESDHLNISWTKCISSFWTNKALWTVTI